MSNDAYTEQQFSTFYLGDQLYGLDVIQVQEIVKPMELTDIPRAPEHVRGFLNLRGQVATAIGLRQLFKLDSPPPGEFMNIICRVSDQLISLQVDDIADVHDVSGDQMEAPPLTVPEHMQPFLHGVIWMESQLLSIVDLDRIFQALESAA